MNLKFLIAEEESSFRNLIRQALTQTPHFEVAGTGINQSHILSQLQQLKPEVLILSSVFELSNLKEFVGDLSQRFPNLAILVLMEAHSTAQESIQLIQAGATTTIKKPLTKDHSEIVAFLQKEIIKSNHAIIVKGRASKLQPSQPPNHQPVSKPHSPAFRLLPSTRFKLIVVGVSTGGPKALEILFKQLPERLPMPMVIVQHMPERFTAKLATSLQKLVKMQVVETFHGQKLQANSIYIAKGGEHLLLSHDSGQMSFLSNKEAPVQSCRPSVDVFFKSVALECPEENILSLVLTGMGQDGADGMEDLKKKRCYSITQDQDSCIVYGMPKAVVDRGLSDRQMSLEEIANFIKGLR